VDRIQVSAEVYEKIAHKEGPQGIGAVIQQDWRALDDLQVDPDNLWIALDAVADPGNLGTIMRTAEAVGAEGIILLGNSTDPYDPTAVKASMGALFSLTLTQTHWDAFREWKRAKGISMVGTSDHAQADYQAVQYNRPSVLLMGSERHGLSAEMEAACDHMVRIPMEGRGDSLNLAVAAAVVLYEIYNQSRNHVTIMS
jgi:TrmH family RNA methyltransferase